MLSKFALPLAAAALAAAAFSSFSAGAQPAGAAPGPVATPGAPPPGPGLDLINERCGFCHTTAQVFVEKPAGEWAVVVQSMIDRGAELEPAEQKTVTDYLNAHYTTGGGSSAKPAAGGTMKDAGPPTPHIN